MHRLMMLFGIWGLDEEITGLWFFLFCFGFVTFEELESAESLRSLASLLIEFFQVNNLSLQQKNLCIWKATCLYSISSFWMEEHSGSCDNKSLYSNSIWCLMKIFILSTIALDVSLWISPYLALASKRGRRHRSDIPFLRSAYCSYPRFCRWQIISHIVFVPTGRPMVHGVHLLLFMMACCCCAVHSVFKYIVLHERTAE